MTQVFYGLLLYIFLAMPPVVHFLESIMVLHMHMQMPMLVASGFFMAPFFQKRFPQFFSKWNGDGVPGIVLFSIIMVYWTIPRTMDEALTIPAVELFKFISIPFLAGVPLRDSWMKLSKWGRHVVLIGFTLLFIVMGLLYVLTPVQLCNSYLVIDQFTLGWGFLTTSIGMIVYLIYAFVVDPSKYEGIPPEDMSSSDE
ncbi:hypothetical protein [Ammoniphilus resinae]|uniref:Uncharacterized protein n=1 Tax=Ammoniphilus resinae TaxID=861532 RepID=A0ABS4GIQ3_9BACL|nr:hypothetical protein [Ammoniphilus resinae]MBP1930135.1 hypothetical protein [Ammoniphilus resinae]